MWSEWDLTPGLQADAQLLIHYDKVLKKYSIPPTEDRIQSLFIFRFRFPPIFYRTKFAQRVNPVLYVTQTRILFQILLSPKMMISRRQISVPVKLELSSQIPRITSGRESSHVEESTRAIFGPSLHQIINHLFTRPTD